MYWRPQQDSASHRSMHALFKHFSHCFPFFGYLLFDAVSLDSVGANSLGLVRATPLGAGAIASAPTTANAAARRRKSLAGAALSLGGEIVSTITQIDEDENDGDHVGPSATTTAASVAASDASSATENGGSSSNHSVPKGGWVYNGPSFDRFENLDVVSPFSDISISRELFFIRIIFSSAFEEMSWKLRHDDLSKVCASHVTPLSCSSRL